MTVYKQYLTERNEKIRTRYNVLKTENTQEETLDKVASEFGLSKDSINTIVFRSNKNRAN